MIITDIEKQVSDAIPAKESQLKWFSPVFPISSQGLE